MLVPVDWMRDYVSLEEDDRTLAERVNDSGSHVDAVIDDSKANSGTVVGRIKDIREDASLKTVVIVDVELPEEVVTVVTGAKNMKVGDKVLLARVGAKLAGGKEIGAAQVGPVLSEGMLCSYDELGFADNVIPKNMAEGIIVFGDDVEIGTDGNVALGLTSPTIEFEITPNRPDCLSIVGMARETAATFLMKMQLPEAPLKYENATAEEIEASGLETIETAFNGVRLETEDCLRFVYRVIDDVQIAASPQWLQNRLMKAGMRPINNIVDLTNYVMLEYGQPMHAFDISTIRGNEIIVRKAKEGERLTTLDGTDRALDTDMMLICDAEGPIGLAGVMGGLNSEIAPTTKRILLETAIFDQMNVQSTSQKLKLRTEASTRFEKGVNYDYAEDASKRMCSLVEQLGAGVTLPGRGEVVGREKETHAVSMRVSRCNQLLGTKLSAEEMKKHLDALELETTYDETEGVLTCVVPPFRHDIEREVDLIEEVARLYGLANIAPKKLVGTLTRGVESDLHRFANENREVLYGLAFDETLTYSFGSPKNDEKLRLEEGSALLEKVLIRNPLGEDFSVMRSTLQATMLDTVRKNRKSQNEDLRFFEVSNTYHPVEGALPEERVKAVVSMCGDYDFYDLKSNVVQWLKGVGMQELRFVQETENPTFHPGRTARIYTNDVLLGVMGEVHPLVLENFEIDKPVFLCEVDLDTAIAHHTKVKQYKPVGRFPSMVRDMALVVDYDTTSEAIETVIWENGSELLRGVELFDIYTGKQIEAGKKSLAYQLSFASMERTLKDEEVSAVFQRVLDALEVAFGIRIRA